MPEEPKSWPAESDGDALLGNLRQQIDAARRRLAEHRDQMEAIGLTRTDASDDPDLTA